MSYVPIALPIGILFWGCLMQPAAADAEQGLEMLKPEHLPEYVIGFPAYVAVTVKAKPEVNFNALRFADLTGLKSSIGVEMKSATGETIRSIPAALIDEDLGLDPETLDGGEVRRMLADVSPLFGPDPQPGVYAARFFFVSLSGANPSAEVTIRLRKATAAEESAKKALAPDKPQFPTWSQWSITCSGASIETPKLPSGDPLVFALMLKQLFCGTGRLRSLNPATLDIAAGLYEPEREALKAELLNLRGDEDGYRRIRSRTLERFPGLAWWFRMIDEGGGYIDTFSRRPR
jgi:hypothetical protein